jgi:hypothetical protein
MRMLNQNNPAVNVNMFRIRNIQKVASPVLNHKINGDEFFELKLRQNELITSRRRTSASSRMAIKIVNSTWDETKA